MGTHHYVTSDIDVLKGWPKTEKAVKSADVAKSLGLTVFQITARLKGMEGRNLVARNEKGLWGITPAGKAERENPSPSVSGAGKKMRAVDPTGAHTGPPDDSKVPRAKLTNVDWAPSDAVLKECQQRLPEVLQQLAHYQTDKQRFKREIMALQVEKEHCEGVINTKRRGKWTSRVVFDARDIGTTVYIAPDMREYVMATAWETADLLIGSKVSGISDTRLRLFSTSQAAKKAKKNEKVKQIEDRRALAKEQDTRNKRILSAEDGRAVSVAEEDGDEGSDALDAGIVWHTPGEGNRIQRAISRRTEKDVRRTKRDGSTDRRTEQQSRRPALAKVRSSPDSRDGKKPSRSSGNDRGSHGRNR